MQYLLPWQESQAKALFGDEMQSLTPELSALTPELSKSKSGHAEKVYVITDLEDLDATEVEKLERIAQPVSNRQCAKAVLVQQTVLALCAERYVGLRVLAELLHRRDRDGADLRQRILNPLVAQGALKRAYPRPNDPRQAYMTVSK